MLYKKIYNFGDKLEDKTRVKLSHYPITYAFIGGTGVILFWRGIWHTADYLMELFFVVSDNVTTTSLLRLPWWDGPLSIAVGAILLLVVGLFVTSFIGNEIIISGLKKEKKIVEKTEDEIESEMSESRKLEEEIHEIENRTKRIEEILKK